MRDKLQRESSFFALAPCFRRGDIVDFCFLQKILNSRITAKMPEYLLAFEENTILESRKAGTPLPKLDRFEKRRFSLVISIVIIPRTQYDIRPWRTFVWRIHDTRCENGKYDSS